MLMNCAVFFFSYSTSGSFFFSAAFFFSTAFFFSSGFFSAAFFFSAGSASVSLVESLDFHRSSNLKSSRLAP